MDVIDGWTILFHSCAFALLIIQDDKNIYYGKVLRWRLTCCFKKVLTYLNSQRYTTHISQPDSRYVKDTIVFPCTINSIHIHLNTYRLRIWNWNGLNYLPCTQHMHPNQIAPSNSPSSWSYLHFLVGYKYAFLVWSRVHNHTNASSTLNKSILRFGPPPLSLIRTATPFYYPQKLDAHIERNKNVRINKCISTHSGNRFSMIASRMPRVN